MVHIHACKHSHTYHKKINLKVKAPSTSAPVPACFPSGAVCPGPGGSSCSERTQIWLRRRWLPALRLPGCVGHASTCLSFLTCQCRGLAGDPPARGASLVAGPEGPACPAPGRPQEGAAWRGARAARAARGAETGSASAPSSRVVLGRGARGGSKRRREPRGSTAAARAMEPE